MYRAMYSSDTGLGITLQYQCTPLSTGSSPERKTWREPGRADHVPRTTRHTMCVVCRVSTGWHINDHDVKNLHTHEAKSNGDWEWDIYHLMSGELWLNRRGIYGLMGWAFMT